MSTRLSLEPGKPDLLNVVVQLRNPRLNGNNLLYDIKLVEGVLPASGDAAVLFIDVLGFWRRNVRRVAIVGTSTAIAASAAVSASEATPRAATMVPPPRPAQKISQLKAMLQEGLITPAQYQKASQELLNHFVQ